MSVIRVLFIGNSHTYVHDVPRLLEGLARKGPVKIATKQVTVGGATLAQLWNEGRARAAIQRGRWDVVVLQEQSSRPITQPAAMHRSVRQFDEEIRKRGAKTLLYLTWAKQYAPATQAELNRATLDIADELGAGVAPVGIAWQNVAKSSGNIALHSADANHASPAGAYLAVCVFYSALTDRPAAASAARSLKLRESEASILRDAAWVTWRQFKADRQGGAGAAGTADMPIRAAIRKRAAELKKLALDIHRCPELGYEEERACAWQVALLRKWGFRVERLVAGIGTAFRATFGKGKPVLAILSEYDALPKLGHACGHNLICTAGLGAAAALAERMKAERLPGTVLVVGTPAEESKGGKVHMVEAGVFRGIDAAIMAHPSHRTMPDHGHSAVTRFEVAFHGRSAHAAAQPQDGLNALDAVMLLFHAVNAWRQQLPEASRIHGVVRDGGAAPNIIPDRASASFFVRSPREDVLAAMIKRFRAIVKGAALMTGTRGELSPPADPYRGGRPNRPLNEAWLEAARAAGMDQVDAAPRQGRASTDFCDVQQAVPGSHVYFAISKKRIPSHSIVFREAAGSAYGLEQMLRAAEALARVGYRFLADAAFRAEVKADFSARREA